MSARQPKLRTIKSTGIKADRPGINDWGEPCGGCQRTTRFGEEITRYEGYWWHIGCATRDIAARRDPVRKAWITLGHQLAAHPRSFNVTETRVIVRANMALVHDDDVFRRIVDPDDDPVDEP